jgi:hypothetical protein
VTARRRTRARPRAAALALGVALAGAGRARAAAAQEAGEGRRFQPEARLDVIAARETAVYAGAGVSTAMGNYLRFGAVLAAGATTGSGDARATVRGDLLARFLFDPFLQSRWALYGGGGFSARYDDGGPTRGYLLAVVGVEGPPVKRVLPALEVGLGGGTRISAAFRRAFPDRR